MIALGWSRPAAAAACGTWSANFDTSPKSAHEPEALTYSWATVVGSCGPTPPPATPAFAFNHYNLCRKDGASPPSSPTESGTTCIAEGTRTTTSKDEWVHRSNKQYATAIFACGDSGCTTWFGDGGTGRGTASGTTDTVTTDHELYSFPDLTSLTSNDRMIVDAYVSAPAAFMYPTYWDANNDHLGLWWNSGLSPEVIYQYVNPTSGWSPATPSSWNKLNWTAVGLGVSPIAESTSAGDFVSVSHMWVAPETIGGADRIRMFFQGPLSPTAEGQNYFVDSVDAAGSDFDLGAGGSNRNESGGGICSAGKNCDYDDVAADGDAALDAVCTDGSSGCSYIASALHGRMMWDELGEGVGADFGTDTPDLLYTGHGTSTNSCWSYNSAPTPPDPDDIYQATWDTGDEIWEGTDISGSCPAADANFVGDHDPAVLSLPGGEFKAYIAVPNGTSPGTFNVCYYASRGGTWGWGDCADVQFEFQGGSVDTTLEGCLNNAEAIHSANSGNPKEGLLFKTVSGTGCFNSAYNGIIFADHVN